MDVTKQTFQRAQREFRDSISQCDFVAMDMEMTGLYETKQLTPNRQDTKDERYAKLKRGVEAYGVAQVGICLFTWVESKDPNDGCGYYEAKSFNFNVFPATSIGGVPVDDSFMCKNTALDFLSRSSFDFNKWIYHGIPYLRTDDADRMKAERTSLLTNKRPPIEIDERHETFVKDLERALAVFLKSRDKVMKYDTANSYQRKIIYEVVSKHATLGARSRMGEMEIFKGSKKAVAHHNSEKVRKLVSNIEEARGFSTIIEALSSARKPVIGHNMPLDVMHAYSKFFRKLPESRVEFEHEMQRFLPVLIDTKYIIESTPAIKAKYGTSSLEEIAPMLERESMKISDGSRELIRHHAKFTREAASTMHEAGYDAYTTGATFIRLLKLEGGLNLSSISSSCESSSELVLYRYINKLYQALGTELYWHFGASENGRSGS
ncbi:hypothetical protein LPJ53_006027, partial [Coemansia erecta]